MTCPNLRQMAMRSHRFQMRDAESTETVKAVVIEAFV
jgi:hypothetical protein